MSNRKRRTRRPSRWVSARGAAEILELTDPTVPKVLEAAGVRWRQLPTQPRQYLKEDVEALAERSLHFATA
jgi:hypothetical protein